MNWVLIFKTSLIVFGIVIFGDLIHQSLFEDSFVVSLSGLLINSLAAGAYIYRNTSLKRIEQAIITACIVPALFVLLFVVFFSTRDFLSWETNTFIQLNSNLK